MLQNLVNFDPEITSEFVHFCHIHDLCHPQFSKITEKIETKLSDVLRRDKATVWIDWRISVLVLAASKMVFVA